MQLLHAQLGTELDGLLARGGRVTPPGHYMLFALYEDRVPSEARIVRVSRL